MYRCLTRPAKKNSILSSPGLNTWMHDRVSTSSNRGIMNIAKKILGYVRGKDNEVIHEDEDEAVKVVKSKTHGVSFRVGGKKHSFEIGKLARLASGSVTAQAGNTTILATAVSNYSPPSDTTDFMPLSVDYREKFYASGLIPQNIRRREGNGSDSEILKSRVVDRVIRPLFPVGYFNETQVITSVHSYDEENDPVVLSVNAASAALVASDIPWNGPIGCVRIAEINDTLVVNPPINQLENATLNLIYAANSSRCVMIEAEGCQVNEVKMVDALYLAHKSVAPIIKAQNSLAGKLGIKTREFDQKIVPDDILIAARKVGLHKARLYFSQSGSQLKNERQIGENYLSSMIKRSLKKEFSDASEGKIQVAIHDVIHQAFREAILDSSAKKRYDGRSRKEVRPLEIETDVLPSVHGSSIFGRGDTQVLCTVTLGSLDDAQRINDIQGEERKRAMLHYEFPPYCVNEIGRLGVTNRRMIGHGALAEKAITPLLPSREEYPYTIRMTSEVTSSDGSSSMATVCGVSLALQNAGVPIKAPVAGISVGLVTEGSPYDGNKKIKKYCLLTDILGSEDHFGDMDFKIAGTKNGITAIQLDVKLPGVPIEILVEGIKRGREARLKILNQMEKVCSSELKMKNSLPCSRVLRMNSAQMQEIIGPGGENLRDLESLSDAAINVDRKLGEVRIFGKTEACVKIVEERIFNHYSDPVVGEVYNGKIVQVLDFGLIVEIGRKRQGFVHASDFMKDKIKSLKDYVKVGDEIKALCLSTEGFGNVRMSATIVDEPTLKHEKPRKNKTEEALNIKIVDETTQKYDKIRKDKIDEASKIKLGNIYSCEVLEIFPNGLQVKVNNDVIGWIHISEAANSFTVDLSQIFKIGDQFEAVYNGNSAKGSICLSVNQLYDAVSKQRKSKADILRDLKPPPMPRKNKYHEGKILPFNIVE